MARVRRRASAPFLAAAWAALALAAGCRGGESPPAAPPPEPKPPASGRLTVEITGRNYQWHVRYPGPDGRVGTGDDLLDRQNLHLPAGSRVTLRLRSDDFAYSLHLPGFDMIEVIMPGAPYPVDLLTGEPGSSPLRGNQMCGFSHPELIGEVVVHPKEQYAAWRPSAERP